VLEPQSTGIFVLLMVIFAALIWWMLVMRQAVFRALAACLAFVLAMLFGVVAVNKYYGYYETWGAAVSDITGAGAAASSQLPGTRLVSGPQAGARGSAGSRDVYLQLARQQGYTLRRLVTGARSHITRLVYIYLPPQYFQPAYRRYKFPVIELIHGQPGAPQDWINVVGVTYTFDRLLAAKLARPAVLVMPDANGGERVSLQCLNQVGGPQDLTYLARDLPAKITRMLRVQPPGPAWGVAGYSEGGFCAANMALRFRRDYGFAGVMSGYFRPSANQLLHPLRQVSPFGGNQKRRGENTPLAELRQLPGGTVLPQFWLGAGARDRQDVAAAELFWPELELRQADVPLTLTPGDGHTMTTWRAEVPALLIWMTRGLARNSQHAPRPPGRAVTGRVLVSDGGRQHGHLRRRQNPARR
jgi:enterochelin esterase-like enzyme